MKSFFPMIIDEGLDSNEEFIVKLFFGAGQ
jgi:hypothetical protein